MESICSSWNVGGVLFLSGLVAVSRARVIKPGSCGLIPAEVKDFFFALCGLDSHFLTRINAQWEIHGFSWHNYLHYSVNTLIRHLYNNVCFCYFSFQSLLRLLHWHCKMVHKEVVRSWKSVDPKLLYRYSISNRICFLQSKTLLRDWASVSISISQHQFGIRAPCIFGFLAKITIVGLEVDSTLYITY